MFFLRLGGFSLELDPYQGKELHGGGIFHRDRPERKMVVDYSTLVRETKQVKKKDFLLEMVFCRICVWLITK